MAVGGRRVGSVFLVAVVCSVPPAVQAFVSSPVFGYSLPALRGKECSLSTLSLILFFDLTFYCLPVPPFLSTACLFRLPAGHGQPQECYNVSFP
jgi:hypothetical protein